MPARVRRSLALAAVAALLAWGTWPARRVLAAEPQVVSFLPPVASDSGNEQPSEIERADFNGDGLPDLAIITVAGSGKVVNFLLGDGAGHLLLDNTIAIPYATGLATGDFNADGIMDFAFTQSSNKTASDGFCPTLAPGTVVFLGAGGATPGFTFKSCIVANPAGYLNDAVAADFNADGKLDLAVGDAGTRGLRVYRGVGDGTFLPAINAAFASGVSFDGPFAARDVNGDGHQDLLAQTTNGGLATFLGNGTGTLTFYASAVGTTALATQSTRTVAFGDLNNDGRLDVAGVTRGAAVAGGTQQHYFFASLGTATGTAYTFGTEAFPLTGSTPGMLAIADFNKDAAKDVIVLDQQGNLAYVFLGRGNGTFAAGPVLTVGAEPQFVATGDWNGDNWIDLAVVDRNPAAQSRTWILLQVPGVGDAVSPTVAITSPASGSTVQGAISITADASDASGIDHVEFFRGNVSLGTDSSSPYAVPWDTNTVPNGTQTLVARAYDAFENPGASTPVTVTVANIDSTPPTVTLTAPAAGTLLHDVVTLSAAASDGRGVSRVEFRVGATLVGTVLAAPYNLAWNTVGFPAGYYPLTATAYDGSGNSATTPAVNVTVDQLPIVAVTPLDPIEATSPAGATVTLSAIASDPDAADALTVAWDLYGTTLGTAASITVPIPLGVHPVTFRATDSYGAMSEDFVQVQVEDTTAPTLGPPAAETREATGPDGAVVTFAPTATDIADPTPTVSCVPASGSRFALGTATVSCTAVDDSGNTSLPVTFTVTVRDTTPPVLTVPANLVVEATSPAGASVTFAASATDLVDGTRPVNCTPASGMAFPLGTTPVSCSSTDTRGNAASAGFTVTVRDSTGPAVAMTSPAAGATVTGIVAIAAGAVDNTTVAQVAFFAGAQALGVDPVAPYEAVWDTAALASGTPVLVRAIATDAAGNATETSIAVTVVHPDVLPPSVIAPAPIIVAATQQDGARANLAASAASQALFAYIGGGSATDAEDPAPVRLAAQATIGGALVDVADSTLFPVGVTAVTFRFRDAAGNVGSAPSAVTVLPAIGGAVARADEAVTATDAGGLGQPVTATFAIVRQAGLLTADPIAPPSAAPPGLSFRSAVYDVVTTAITELPITVCIAGSGFTAAHRLLHFENGAWTDVTQAFTASAVCGAVVSLSPFVLASPDNQAPTVDAGPAQTVEATSAAGASVTLTATATDPDAGDVLAYEWTEGTAVLGTGASINVVLPLGAHTLTVTVTDSGGASASANTAVAVQDSAAPILTLPADMAVEATTAAGTAVSFAASALDAVAGSVSVTCAPPSGSTFQIGMTPVTCSAADASSNRTSGTFTVAVRDTTPPTVSLGGPGPGPVAGVVMLSALAADAVGIGRIEFYADSALLGTVTAAPYELPWNSTLATNSVHTLIARAYDSAGNTSDASVAVTVANPIPPVTSLTLTSNLPYPQRPGTTIVFTASAAGGVGPLQYQWRVFDGATWQVAKPWSTETTFAWTPTLPSGAAIVMVGVRSAPNVSDVPERSVSRSFPILNEFVTAVTLTPDRPSPQALGTTITFTASATGACAPEYEWWLYDGARWTLMQGWTTVRTLAWTPAAPNPSYAIQVWARCSGNTANAAEKATGLSFRILSEFVTAVTLTPDRASPQVLGTTITFTASATGACTPEYEWWLYDGARWTLMQGWTTARTLAWTPAATNPSYAIQVWARCRGNTANAAEKATGLSFAILPTVISGLTLNPDKAAPQRPGTAITFTAAATGGAAPAQYKFWVYDGAVWTVAQNWSTSASFAWTPTAVNPAAIVAVWARSDGNPMDAAEKSTSRSFPILETFVTGVTLTSDLPPPQAAGTTITFTATATGVPQAEYRWWLFDGASWTSPQNWSTQNTFVWTPLAANPALAIQVWARTLGNTANAAEKAAGRSFPIVAGSAP